MIALATLIERFGQAFLAQHGASALPIQRGRVFTAGAAARVAQGFPAGTQLWVFAPQQQTLDCVAAFAGVQDLWQGSCPVSTSAPN
jgi:hypothetical protein